MSDILGILERSCTKVGVPASSRKALLQYASDLLAEEYDLPARQLFDELMNRERLGSTGLGDGVAIPHCRIACEKIHAACLTLAEPVDYDAIDGEPVDLIFILLVPPEEHSAHLELLSDLARLYGSDENRTTLRRASTDDELYETFTGLMSSRAA
jgi:PTS system nitrogen regulatory IIA component